MCLPPTLSTITGRHDGGRHYYFTLPEGASIGNSVGKLGQGLDVRGTGGYVVLPASVHPDTGKLYAFDEDEPTEPVEAPQWVLEKLTTPDRKPKPATFTATPPTVGPRELAWAARKLEGVCKEAGVMMPGSRNFTLNNLAYTMGREVGAGRIHREEVFNALWNATASYRAQDGNREVEKTINSGLDSGGSLPSEPLGERDDLGLTLDLPGFPAATPGASVNESAPWPDPEPLSSTLPPVDKLTPDMLPMSLRPMVEDIAARMQVPIDFPAVVAVQTLAGAVGRRAYLQPKRNDSTFRVFPNLWGGIVAPPSSMKTPTINAVTGAIRELEAEWLGEYTAAKEVFDLESRMDKLGADAWESTAKKAIKKGERPAPRPVSASTAPVQRRLLVTDATFEALHTIMAANPAGVFMLRDELTGWFAGLERQGREQERGFALESWNGDGAYTVDRVGRGSIHVPHTCMSIFGSIQPSRLRAYLADTLRGGPSNDGLMQRFQLLVWPDAPEGTWVQVDTAPNAPALEKAGAIYRRLASMDATEPRCYRFNVQAQELYTEWITVLENRLRSRIMGEVMEAHLGKYRKLMPSLALLFALADGEQERVTLHHAKLAAQWCDYLETHARRVYSAHASPERAAVIALGQHIAAGDLGRQFTLRDLYRRCWHGLGSKEEATPALKELELMGWVRRSVGDGTKPGRPASETVIVNPKLEARHGRT